MVAGTASLRCACFFVLSYMDTPIISEQFFICSEIFFAVSKIFFTAYGSKWVFFREKNTHSSFYRSFWVLNSL